MLRSKFLSVRVGLTNARVPTSAAKSAAEMGHPATVLGNAREVGLAVLSPRAWLWVSMEDDHWG